MPARLVTNLAKGVAAGLLGTAAMTVSSTVEMKLRDRGSSNVPVAAASRVLGIEGFTSDDSERRFGQLVHWVYGTAWGVGRGFTGSVLPPVAADAAHFGAVWGAEHVLLPTLEVAPPAPEWGARELAVDAWHHVVYAAATGKAFRWLDRRG